MRKTKKGKKIKQMQNEDPDVPLWQFVNWIEKTYGEAFMEWLGAQPTKLRSKEMKVLQEEYDDEQRRKGST